MGWTVRGSNPGREKEMFLLSETSRPALRLTQPPILWVPGSFPGAERGREVNHLLDLVPRLQIGGSLPPLVMVWTWKNFFCHFSGSVGRNILGPNVSTSQLRTANHCVGVYDFRV